MVSFLKRKFVKKKLKWLKNLIKLEYHNIISLNISVLVDILNRVCAYNKHNIDIYKINVPIYT